MVNIDGLESWLTDSSQMFDNMIDTPSDIIINHSVSTVRVLNNEQSAGILTQSATIQYNVYRTNILDNSVALIFFLTWPLKSKYKNFNVKRCSALSQLRTR